jgi:hypothetical protein
MTPPNFGNDSKPDSERDPGSQAVHRIGVDSHNERAEEFDLGKDTICLAGADQMIVANSVMVRGLWDDEDELYSIQLELSCTEDQLRILRQLKILPSTVPVEEGPGLKLFFEMEAGRVGEAVLSELGDAQNVGELFLAEDRFPPILNLLHYELRKVELKHTF